MVIRGAKGTHHEVHVVTAVHTHESHGQTLGTALFILTKEPSETRKIATFLVKMGKSWRPGRN